MSKKILTTIILIIVLFMGISSYCTKVYGADTIDGVIEGADSFLSAGNGKVQYDETQLHEVSNLIYNLLLGIAFVLAVIIGIILGIQFMTASVEQKAKIKESLMAYAGGCAVVFGAFGIWKLAIIVFSNF